MKEDVERALRNLRFKDRKNSETRDRGGPPVDRSSRIEQFKTTTPGTSGAEFNRR
jgi:hypothetical protein